MSHHRENIAVVGIGCKVPGAENADQFWQLLVRGENHVTEIPKDRWKNEAFYDPDPHAIGKSYVQRAGLLKDPLAFDNKLFNINDFEADQMDPQQRFVCECAYMAMEDGGFTREQFAGSRTGVYVGAMNADYRGLFSGKTSIVNNYTVTGVSNSIIAARLSFIFDLRGPSLTLDTACSSGLLAVHLGVQALRTGDCDMALCGGTNFLILPETFVHLSKARMVSPTGQCFAFSDRADGYTRGEGCAMILIKRLKDAERDGDHIWATLETGSNQDGHAVTPISAPSGDQQFRLLEHIYKTSGIDTDCIDYIEAHGTGTAAGDPVEINALGRFFRAKGAERLRHVGSVKTNVGHLESAAGTAGLVKVLLMMKHSKIVPSLFFDRPNPKIDFQGLNLSVPTEVLDWLNPQKIACVNSFGMGGTNCHAVALAHKVTFIENEKPVNKNTPCIVCFSAKNEKSLKGSIEDFTKHPELNLLNVHDISYTSTVRRSHYNIRYAAVIDDMQELLTCLDTTLHEGTRASIAVARSRVVYVFCGMGTTWRGMCNEFMKTSGVFRDAIREIDSHLCDFVSWSLVDRFDNEYDPSDNEFSAIAIFACQIGLGKLWESLGVVADCIVGQSVGEVAAAFFAGILSMGDAVKIIYYRTSVLAKAAGGTMIVVKNMKVEMVEAVVKNYAGSANVSLRYSPVACAISGDSDAILKIKQNLLSKASSLGTQIQIIDLEVTVAYHSHHVEKCKAEFREAIADISPHSPCKEMISSVTGQVITGPLGPQYWLDNMREPVSFYEAVEKTLKKTGKNVFIEIGPKPVMRAHVNDIFPTEDMVVIMSMSKAPEWKIFLRALATIYEIGVKIIWKNLPCQSKQVTPIPRYCFNLRRNLDLSESAHFVLSGFNYLESEHAFLRKVDTPNQFTVIMSHLTFPSVYDHTVSDMLIIPGAFYAEIGFGVSLQTVEMNAPMYSVGVSFEQPCSFTRQGVLELHVDVKKAAPCQHGVEKFESYDLTVMKGSKTFASIHLQAHNTRMKPTTINVTHIYGRCPQMVKREEIYTRLRQFGFTYGPNYSLIMHAQRSSLECIAKIVFPQDLKGEAAKTTIHPSILDAMIQTAVILTDDSNNVKDLFPRSIEKLTSFKATETEMYIITRRKRSDRNQALYDAKLTTLSGEIIADMENLVIKSLAGNTKEMEDMHTSIWMTVESEYPTEVTKLPNVLFITDKIPENTTSSLHKHCHEIDVMKDSGETVIHGFEALLKNSTNYELIALVFNTEVDDNEDAAMIHTKVLHLCMILKHIYTYAAEELLSLPIYLFTKNALTFKDGPAEKENVNPLMTTLWGMTRCALKERVYTDFLSLDLHISSENYTLTNLASIAGIINRNSTLKNYPEWLVTEESLYVNQFVQNDPQTPLPTFRNNFVDSFQKVILLSKDSAIPTDTVLVHHESKISHERISFVKMNVDVTALQNPNLFSMKIPYKAMENSKDHNDNYYPLFALEHKGTAQIESCGKKQMNDQMQVVSCYPTPVGSKIEVPMETTLCADMITNYAPGDLTKLIVLWSLFESVTTDDVTILASFATAKFGEALMYMLTSRQKPKPVKANVVMIEELDKGKCFSQTILSLVLIEETIVPVLAHCGSHPKLLIVLTPLLEPAMTTSISFHLPKTEIKVLDPSTFFHPEKIKLLVPNLKNWIKKHAVLMPKVAACLHKDLKISGDFINVISDLNDLLEVMLLKTDGVTAQVDKSELFRKDAVYIVVGGLSGLGWFFVNFLAQKGAGNIAILNRRQATTTKQNEIEQLSSFHNSKIKAFQADVTNMASLRQFLSTVTKAFPGTVLKGVFFGAAVVQDQLVLQTDPKVFAEVLAPKVMGTWNMHQLTKNIPLDYFVMHSSITSVVGNAGQASYASANAFMDGLAHYRKHMNLSGQSINWGALDMGILTDKTEVKKSLQAQGFIIMSEDNVAELILPVLLLNRGQIAPCKFNDQILHQRVRRDMLIPFQYRMKTMLGTGTEEVQIENDIKQRLQASRELPLNKRGVLYEQYITALVYQVLGTDDGTIELDTNLLEVGMDSTFAMILVNQIYKEINCRIPPIILLSGSPSVKTIVQSIETQLSGMSDDIPELGHSPEVHAMNGVPEVHATNGVPEVHATNGVPGVHAMNGVPEVHAINRVPEVHAMNGVPEVHATNGVPGVHAMNGVPEVHAINRVPEVHAMNGVPEVHATNGVPEVHAMNRVTKMHTMNGARPENNKENEEHDKQNSKSNTYSCSSFPGSLIESCLLTPHKRYTRKERLHGVVDLNIPSEWNSADTFRQAIISTLQMHQSACSAFKTSVSETGMSQFQRIFLDCEEATDFRITEKEEDFEKYCEEEFNVEGHALLRFVLLQSTQKKLRIIFHKAGFDESAIKILIHSFQSALHPHVTRSNGEEDIFRTTPLKHSIDLDNELNKIYKSKAGQCHLFWRKTFGNAVKVRSDSSYVAPPQMPASCECVRKRLPSDVSKKLISFLRLHHVSLLGLVAGAYQTLIHIMTGKPLVSLMFTSNLRHHIRGLENYVANCSNEIPLLAKFNKSKKANLRQFILENSHHIQECIDHGLLPLTLFQDLVDQVTEVCDQSPHAISIDMLSDQDAIAVDTPQGRNGLTSTPAILSMGRETSLAIQHNLGTEVIVLNLCYKTCLINRIKAEALMKELIGIISNIVTKKGLQMRHLKKHNVQATIV